MPIRDRNQLAIDETIVDDDDLAAALDDRQKKREALGAVNLDYKQADTRARALVDRLELPDGRAVRVGKWRIERKFVAGGSVAFERGPKSRVTITPAIDE